MQKILDAIQVAGIFPVIEIERLEDAVPVAKALWDGGIHAMEITLRSDVACEAIRKVCTAYPDMLVGAGTVLSPDQVDKAREAGAQYIVTPGYNPRVVSYCQDNGVLIIPGLDSPSCIELALEAGLTAVKFFPAESRGGMKGLKSMAAPYKNRIKFLPLGGIGPGNMADYAKADCILAVGGTWLAKRDYIRTGDFEKITLNARLALTLLHGFELLGAELDVKDDTASLFKTLNKVFAPTSVPGITPLAAAGDTTPVIRIGCNNIYRAVLWLRSQGRTVSEVDPDARTAVLKDTRDLTVKLIEKP